MFSWLNKLLRRRRTITVIPAVPDRKPFDYERVHRGWFDTAGAERFRPLADVTLPGTPAEIHARQTGKMEEEIFLSFLVTYLKERKEWEEINRVHFWNSFISTLFEEHLALALIDSKEEALTITMWDYAEARLGMLLLYNRDLIHVDDTDTWFWLDARLIEHLLGTPHALDSVIRL